MTFEPGDIVERRYGDGEHRFGHISGRVREGYDAWYVNAAVGMTYCDNGRDLRLAPRDDTNVANEQPATG
jgi:hypothetical protein